MLRGPFAAAAIMCAAPAAVATTVSPINIEMTCNGAHSRAHITVTNTSTDPIAIAPDTESMRMAEKGHDTRDPAGDDFLILPTQALIPAGGTQVFRVQWLGDPQLAEGKSYLITMTQLPVKGLKARSALAVSVSFAVAVNVAAAGVTPELTVKASGIKRDPQGKLRPYLVVENPTATHALLKDAAITLVSDNWSSTLAPGALINSMGTGLVQPHKRREFLLPLDVPPGASRVTATLDYQPGR